MWAQSEVMEAFIEEFQNGLLVTLQGAIFGLESRMKIMHRMMHANEIKEGLASQSVLMLDDACSLAPNVEKMSCNTACVSDNQSQSLDSNRRGTSCFHTRVSLPHENPFGLPVGGQKLKQLHTDPTCLVTRMEFHAPIANNCWDVGFGQRFWRSRRECFLLFLIPLGEVAEVEVH